MRRVRERVPHEPALECLSVTSGWQRSARRHVLSRQATRVQGARGCRRCASSGWRASVGGVRGPCRVLAAVRAIDVEG
jgi:hypothetical protein